ncbi:MAG: hypothetical protein KatS3mg117_1825 [Geminicoccaceae bacterium]|nr:MAG: hypothetical protein KatS3mg117_1825 [Geminicoccaceae bacterium]
MPRSGPAQPAPFFGKSAALLGHEPDVVPRAPGLDNGAACSARSFARSLPVGAPDDRRGTARPVRPTGGAEEVPRSRGRRGHRRGRGGSGGNRLRRRASLRSPTAPLHPFPRSSPGRTRARTTDRPELGELGRSLRSDRRARGRAAIGFDRLPVRSGGSAGAQPTGRRGAPAFDLRGDRRPCPDPCPGEAARVVGRARVGQAARAVPRVEPVARRSPAPPQPETMAGRDRLRRRLPFAPAGSDGGQRSGRSVGASDDHPRTRRASRPRCAPSEDFVHASDDRARSARPRGGFGSVAVASPSHPQRDAAVCARAAHARRQVRGSRAGAAYRTAEPGPVPPDPPDRGGVGDDARRCRRLAGWWETLGGLYRHQGFRRARPTSRDADVDRWRSASPARRRGHRSPRPAQPEPVPGSGSGRVLPWPPPRTRSLASIGTTSRSRNAACWVPGRSRRA